MSRKKRSSPLHQKAVSVTPKTHCSEDEAQSIVLSSIDTQSSHERSTSGFTPKAKKRRNTFGNRKAPQVYHSISDDMFFSPSILCRKSVVKIEDQMTRTKDRSRSSSPSNESSSSQLESQLDRQFDFPVQQASQEKTVSTLSSDFVNESFHSEGASIIVMTRSEPQNTKIVSEDNEFDFDDTTTIHSSTNISYMKQPSSTMTSLHEARAYYAQLDASPIVVEAIDERERHRKVVRTRRRLLPTHPTVMNEYKEYVKACDCAHVPAMPLEEFARHRKKFQANDVLYEGFLDVDD